MHFVSRKNMIQKMGIFTMQLVMEQELYAYVA